MATSLYVLSLYIQHELVAGLNILDNMDHIIYPAVILFPRKFQIELQKLCCICQLFTLSMNTYAGGITDRSASYLHRQGLVSCITPLLRKDFNSSILPHMSCLGDSAAPSKAFQAAGPPLRMCSTQTPPPYTNPHHGPSPI